MNDCFDSAVQRIAREKNGDRLSKEVFWDIVVALDIDSRRRHEELLAGLEGLRQETKQWQGQHIASCHRASLPRKGDPPGADSCGSRETWVMWNVGKKVGAALLAIAIAAIVTLVNIALNYIWFGHP